MAININSREKNVKKVRFPKLMKSKTGNSIMLVTGCVDGRISGTVLRSSEYKDGHVFLALMEDMYEDYAGVLTMFNDEE